MRVLLDTNIVLDLILRRAGFIQDAEAIFQAQDRGKLSAYVSAITPGTAYYVTRRAVGSVTARQAIADLLLTTRVCAVDQTVLQKAVGLPLADYEDAIQLASALAEQLDAIVTRDPNDFQSSPIPVFSPAELLAKVK
jgi:predicted nucleic acid-binding protein